MDRKGEYGAEVNVEVVLEKGQRRRWKGLLTAEGGCMFVQGNDQA
jgi:hypothetical protein